MKKNRMFTTEELITLLIINLILWLIMFFGRPVVFIVKKLPRFGPLKPLGLNFLMLVFITAEEYSVEPENSYVLRHEFAHYRQSIRFTPLLLALIHFCNMIYLIAKYRSVQQIYYHLWIERNADNNLPPSIFKHWCINLCNKKTARN